FTHHSIAVLRVDDRGVGGSSGSIAASTTDEFADDALAAVGVLEQRSDILRSRIGLLGHSEGAATAAIAASRSSKIAFVVWMAGSAVSGAEILQMQAASIARAGGASEAAVSEILRHHAAFMTALKENAPTDRLIALGRSLAAAQLAVLPAEQRASFGDLAT